MNDDAAARTPAIIDQVMPVFHFCDRRIAVICATPEQIYRANMEFAASDIGSLKPLFWLREIPALVTGKGMSSVRTDIPFWEMAISEESPWRSLGEHAPMEAVMGAIGDFARPDIRFEQFTGREEFESFFDPSQLKTLLGFRIVPGGNQREGYTTIYESRTYVPDPAKRRVFGWYWALIRPFEGMMLRQGLAAVKRRAEAAHGDKQQMRQEATNRAGLLVGGLIGLGIGAVLLRRRKSDAART